MKKIAILSFLTLLIFSCNKIEGKGGTSSIVGKLIINDVNGAGDINATFVGADEDVFIIYGKDNTTQNDKVTTSYDGTYRFDNLITGTYKIFAYSKCNACDSGMKEVITEVVIGSKSQVITAPELTIEQ